MKESSDELHPVCVLCHDMRMLLYFSCFVVDCICVCFESSDFEMQINYWCSLMYRWVLKNWSDHQNLKICLLQPKIFDGMRMKQFYQSCILHFAKCYQPSSLCCAILGKSRLPLVCCKQMIILIEPVASSKSIMEMFPRWNAILGIKAFINCYVIICKYSKCYPQAFLPHLAGDRPNIL